MRIVECSGCGERFVRGEEPDPCLGLLPGVSHACCGHGSDEGAYVVIGGYPDEPACLISNAVTLRGLEALYFFELVLTSTERWQGHVSFLLKKDWRFARVSPDLREELERFVDG